MNAPQIVNENLTSNHFIPRIDENQAYEEIKKACIALNSYYIGDTNQRDTDTTKKILNKYFNKNAPLLDINAPIPNVGWTPLQMTCYFGLTIEARFLLDNGASVANQAEPPLHFAVANGYEPICYTIISENRELINQTNKKGQTPVMLACQTSNDKLISTLLYFKPDMKLTDNEGKDCLDYAKQKENKQFATLLASYMLKTTLSNKNNMAKVGKVNKI